MYKHIDCITSEDELKQADIKYTADYEEYRVRFFYRDCTEDRWVLKPNCDYFTDDETDARATAHHYCTH